MARLEEHHVNPLKHVMLRRLPDCRYTAEDLEHLTATTPLSRAQIEEWAKTFRHRFTDVSEREAYLKDSKTQTIKELELLLDELEDDNNQLHEKQDALNADLQSMAKQLVEAKKQNTDLRKMQWYERFHKRQCISTMGDSSANNKHQHHAANEDHGSFLKRAEERARERALKRQRIAAMEDGSNAE
jgi:predicted nuclease with TOPRIM domain